MPMADGHERADGAVRRHLARDHAGADEEQHDRRRRQRDAHEREQDDAAADRDGLAHPSASAASAVSRLAPHTRIATRLPAASDVPAGHRRHRRRARRLDEHAQLAPQGLHGRLHLVVADEHHLVDEARRQRQRVRADVARRQRAGDGVDARRATTRRPAAIESFMAVAPVGSTPTTRTDGASALTTKRDAADEPAAADGHHDHVEAAELLDELEADGPLPGDDLGILERVHQQRAGLARVLLARPPTRHPSRARAARRARRGRAGAARSTAAPARAGRSSTAPPAAWPRRRRRARGCRPTR